MTSAPPLPFTVAQWHRNTKLAQLQAFYRSSFRHWPESVGWYRHFQNINLCNRENAISAKVVTPNRETSLQRPSTREESLNQDLQDELDEQDYLRLNEITGTDQIAKKQGFILHSSYTQTAFERY